MIRNIGQFARAIEDDGARWYSPVFKTSSPIPGQRAWFDVSMGAGTPKYNAYVGNQAEATPLTGQRNDSIYLGPDPAAGKSRYLHKVYLHAIGGTSAPYYALLCDYLMFYPLIDGDNTDLQELDNTASLPRYADGAGVHVAIVVTTPMATNATMTVNYTNASGVAQSATFGIVTNANTGAIVSGSDSSLSTNSRSPFAPLSPLGVRSIQSVQFNSAAGGFVSLVLMKPLTAMQGFELLVPTELQMFKQKAQMPEVKTGAFLNFICLQGGAGGLVTLHGLVETTTV